MNKEIKDRLIVVLIIISIISLGILAINQYFNWVYHLQFLNSPCQLCEKINNVKCSPTLELNFSGEFILPKP